MRLVPLSSIFSITYGTSLELNRLIRDPNGINFVSRTEENNGISARIKSVLNLEPIEAGVITVAASGSVLSTFVQPEPFYSGFHILCLRPIEPMETREKIYYCSCIRLNRHKYSYGRQANRTLGNLLVPDRKDIPAWLWESKMVNIAELKQPVEAAIVPNLSVTSWKEFKLGDLFDIKKGKRLTKRNMESGLTPYVGAVESNNGITTFIKQKPIHEGNTISVSYNGSVAEAFYQPNSFWATDDVNVLYPKFELNTFISMFLITVIKLEKHRFNYGRKWHLERMKTSIISLPATRGGLPDWDFMANYIKLLPYSSNL